VILKKLSLYCTLILFLGGFANQLNAQSNKLFYTYIGPTAGFGYNIASYKYWDKSSETLEHSSFSGPYADVGCLAAIFTKRFTADLRIVYSMNFNDGKYKVFHPAFTMCGKYFWEINNTFSFAAGLGLYIETPPATSKYYESAGFQIPLSLYVNVTQESKLFFEIAPKLGYYWGADEIPNSSLFGNNYKRSLGINVGYLFKIGRI
jgi:hypothetical protein